MTKSQDEAIKKLSLFNVSLTKDDHDKVIHAQFMLNPKADEIAAFLPAFPNLSYADGAGSSLSDIGMKKIAECGDLEKLDIADCDSLTPEGVRCLQSLKKLRELHFNPKRDADACMKFIAEIKSLHILGLAYSTITDKGLANVSSLSGLEKIDLLGVKTISNKGVQQICMLSHLRKLNLEDTDINDDCMQYVAQASSLESLVVSGTNVTDKGIHHIRGLNQLHMLAINGASTDESLKSISGLTELEGLHLNDTKISDAGLEYLYGLRKLRYLILWDTKISKNGLKKLERALPDCEIATNIK